MKSDEKRQEPRDEQNLAAKIGLTDAPKVAADDVTAHPGKCPTCGRDKANS